MINRKKIFGFLTVVLFLGTSLTSANHIIVSDSQFINEKGVIDISALEVYLSTEPDDKNKNHVIETPESGQNVYFHLKYGISTEGEDVPSFQCKINLDNSLYGQFTVTNPVDGIFVAYCSNHWAAINGDHTICGIVDSTNVIDEDVEYNNNICYDFTVGGIDWPDWVVVLMDLTGAVPQKIGNYWQVSLPFNTDYIPKIDCSNYGINVPWPLGGDYTTIGNYAGTIIVKAYEIGNWLIENSFPSANIRIKTPLGNGPTSRLQYSFPRQTTSTEWGDYYFDCDFGYKFTSPPFYIPVSIIVIEIKLVVDCGGGVKATLVSPAGWNVYNGEIHGDVYDYSGYQYLRITIKGGISIVIASVGIYGKVEYRNYVTPPVHGELCGEIGLYVEIFWVFEGRVQFWKGCIQWPDSINKPSVQDIMRIISPQADIGFTNDDWQLISRDYGAPEWKENNIGILVDEVFPFANPIIASFNDKKIIVWGYDDQTKDQMNGLELQYSIWDGNTFSTPGFITDDNYLEMYPSVTFLDNGDAICVFSVIPDENVNDFNDFVEKVEIGYSYWNHETDEWTPMDLISVSYEYMDMKPVIASEGNKAVVVWICDGDKNIFTVEDTAIYASFWNGENWHSTRKILSGNIISNPISLILRNGEASIAYEYDSDGDLNTVDDIEIYMKTFSSVEDISTIRITNDDSTDASPSISYLGDDLALAWIKDNGNISELYYHEMGSNNNIKIIDGNISNVKLLNEGNSDPVIGWKDSILENLFVTNRINGQWTTDMIYNSSRFINQLFWDYAESTPFAVFIEKEDISSKNNCSLILRTTNNKPNIPARPSGETRIKIGEEYILTSLTEDIDQDRIYYMWDLGDGNYSTWIGPYESGEECNISHIWTSKGNYDVKVKAKDINDGESDWSNPLTVTTQRNKISYFKSILFQFVENPNGPFSVLKQIFQIK